MKFLYLGLILLIAAVYADDMDDLLESCHCGRILMPTCGSNGYMFTSPCELNCYNTKTNSSVVRVEFDQCKKDKE